MKILVATDGSEGSENAARFASKLAIESDSSITLLHVTPKIGTTKEDVITLLKEGIGSPEEAGKKYLDVGVKIAEDFDIKADTKLLGGDPLDEILKEADNFDLVVIGSHGLGAIDRFLLGSVSSELVHKSRTPVLVVR
jgi:nucleotide-binding universal stress UspA family protein